MSRSLCIHGHFYQPPRYDPWIEDVLPEGSAAPFHDWNERIARECYTPVAYARRLDANGHIAEAINAYAFISFNFGPTLLTWMQRHLPETYARILAADAASVQRLGHGNALAQVYHHAILPLAPRLDKEIEIAWAIDDFQHRFRRPPEGMWLAETAVDLDTLDALAAAGIRFTILAPRQAKAIRPIGDHDFQPVDEHSIPTHQPYLVQTPSGAPLAVFFYDGPVSQAVAFERLLHNGETFWQRLVAEVPEGGIRTIATDGESYGHHFPFGEMALAYVIEQGRRHRDGFQLTNLAAFLASHPPQHEALIHENSSWSCVHGVERWRSHCGCSTGEHPDWNQEWRRPLRRALNYLKYYVDDHYFSAMARLTSKPGSILRHYGQVLCGADDLTGFLRRFGVPGDGQNLTQAARLLAMQRWALASFSSCAWFFDDIARIEPLNGLTCARRAMDLLAATGGPDVEAGFVRILAEAHANRPGAGTGQNLWEQVVTPRRPSMHTLALYLTLDGPPTTPRRHSWPGLTIQGNLGEDAALYLQYEWHHTLERATQRIPLTDLARIPQGRHALALARSRIRAKEAALFRTSCQLAEGLDGLLGPMDLGQTRWEADPILLAPGLAWLWMTDRIQLIPERAAALASLLASNPQLRGTLEHHAEAQAKAWSGDLVAHAADLTLLIQRARELGLRTTWWDLQNRVLEHPSRGRLQELCQLLSIRPSSDQPAAN